MAQTVHLVPPQVVRHRPLSKVTRSSQWDLNIQGRQEPQDLRLILTHILGRGRQCIQVLIYKSALLRDNDCLVI